MTEPNGPQPSIQPEQPHQQPLESMDLAEFEHEVRRFLGTICAGLSMTSYNVPVPMLLAVFAKQAGFVVGSSVVADLANHLRIRELLRKAFAEGISEAPKNFPPLPPQMTDTAIRG